MIRARDARIAAQARKAALLEAAASAWSSTQDCMTCSSDDACAACMEASRITGRILGLADRALAAQESEKSNG